VTALYLYLVATPCRIEVRLQKKKGLPIHSQFGRVSRRGFEFVARLSEPTVTEISHLWHRIYHETGGGLNILDFSPNAVIAVPSVVRK
jgi:hypothetical protein